MAPDEFEQASRRSIMILSAIAILFVFPFIINLAVGFATASKTPPSSTLEIDRVDLYPMHRQAL